MYDTIFSFFIKLYALVSSSYFMCYGILIFMKVVLLEDIKGLGVRGDVCVVGDGYAFNFLIPQKKALETADPRGMAVLQRKVTQEELRAQKSRKEQGIVAMLPDSITLRVPASEQGTLFSAVTAEMIVQHLGDLNIPTAPQQFSMDPIKEVGKHTVHYKGGEKAITVVVEKEEQKKKA